MLKFIIKRVLIGAVILLFSTFLIYLLIYNLPSSFIETVARELSTRPNSRPYTEWLELLNNQYGLADDPITGYFTWAQSALKGNFGDSWAWTMPVTQKFKECIWYSFWLALAAFILEAAIAIPLGVMAAKKQYSFTDYTITVFSLIGISMPTFFIATIFKMIFAVNLRWLDPYGMENARIHDSLSALGQFFDTASHFILPCLTLVAIGIGSLMRYTRTNTLEVLNADYIRTARAKGLPEKKVIGYHAFRNTLIPIVTILGNSLPTLFSGALITETLFSIRGIGYISYYSMIGGDIPFSMFYLTFVAILTILGTLVADILYAVVDPRVRVN